MNDINYERSTPWNIYTSSDPTPAQTVTGGAAGGGVDSEAPWKSFGTSMNAISFGFVATAILISMFLIMAIFEHLFKPSPSFSSPEDIANASLESGTFQKLGNPQSVATTYATDFSVVMPGQQYPSYIAQPAPFPCPRPREGIFWPSHEHSFVLPQQI
ncbi:hypothetical protein TIFTF001_001437 [Ficus carica]|uniref:Multidrug resistance protein n=1 Tax=Ficus carica TaxID=3494 RepID=A0AA87Z8T8_FICCA|nr:hypothetical protein TIFTF001_001437 [Ficus carica]